MLGSLIVETFHNITPFLSMFQHTFNQNLIFFISPFIMLDPMIEMIQPSLSTLFAGSEKFPL